MNTVWIYYIHTMSSFLQLQRERNPSYKYDSVLVYHKYI